MIYAQLAQDRPKRAGGEVTATVMVNDSEPFVGRVPPDFKGPGAGRTNSHPSCRSRRLSFL